MKKLLMVDDVATNLRLVSEVLKGQYEVHSARSGEQALMLAQTIIPDLILLDISMPKMDGYTVMDKLNEMTVTANIPVIVLTGDTTRDAEAKALKMGAVDFIRKPFEPMALKARIERALSVVDMRNNLETSSKKDALTGLWNRIYIEDYFDRIPADAEGCMLMLDLDNFKAMNDSYGHAVGDKALISFSNTLIENTTEKDVAARMGGDEFIVIRPDITDREEMRKFCRELIASVEIHLSELIGDVLENPVTVSIGLSFYPADGKDFMTLYNCADKALYYVKQNGKRGYHFYQDDCRTLADIARESNLIDLQQLKMLIGEENEDKGAYQVEYQGFTRIYRFVSRCVNRTGQNVQVVLFTLSLKNPKEDSEILSRAMTELETDLAGLLRRADVATRFTSTQFGVILMDATKDNGMIAVNRVIENFDKLGLSEHVNIDYEIQDICKEN